MFDVYTHVYFLVNTSLMYNVYVGIKESTLLVMIAHCNFVNICCHAVIIIVANKVFRCLQHFQVLNNLTNLKGLKMVEKTMKKLKDNLVSNNNYNNLATHIDKVISTYISLVISY